MSHFKQKHKDYLIKNEIKDLTDLVNYVEILRNTSNLQGEDRQMLFDFAFLIVNEQPSLKSFFAENKVQEDAFRGIFTYEIEESEKTNPSKEFYNAFKKVSEDEDKTKWVRVDFYYTLENGTHFIEVSEFTSLEDAKKYFNNSKNTEAFYYKYGTKELIEKEDKSKNSPTLERFSDTEHIEESKRRFIERYRYGNPLNVLEITKCNTHLELEGVLNKIENKSSPTFMDEVLDSNSTITEEPKFVPGFGYMSKRGKIITYKQKEEFGVKETEGKLNYELDWEFIQQLAERMSQNKGKYKPYNWMQPIDVEKLKQSLFRHVVEVMKGNYEDDGRTFGHLESISANVMMINYQLKNSVK